MSQSFESDQDREINIEIETNLVELLSSPAIIQQIALLVRNDIVGPMARRMGNTAGKTAQRKTPLASKPQPPGTQRVW